MRLGWDKVLDMNIIEVLNIYSYAVDLSAFEQAQIKKHNRRR